MNEFLANLNKMKKEIEETPEETFTAPVIEIIKETEADNMEEYKNKIIKLTNKADWEKNAGFYIKKFKEFNLYDGGLLELMGVLGDVKETFNTRTCATDTELINNCGAFLNTSLQNGLKRLEAIHGKKTYTKETKEISKQLVNINISEFNPGWATTKFISTPRHIRYTDTDGNEHELFVENPYKGTYADKIMPTSESQQIYLAIEYFYKKANCPSGLFKINTQEFLDYLGKSKGGKEFKLLKTHLEILKYTVIRSNNIYKVKNSDKLIYINDSFNFLSRLVLFDKNNMEERESVTDDTHFFVEINSFFKSNIENDYIGLIETKILNKLTAPLDYHLGTLICRRKGQNNKMKEITFELTNLIDRLGIVTKNPKEINRKLTTSCESLIEKKIISGYNLLRNKLEIHI